MTMKWGFLLNFKVMLDILLSIESIVDYAKTVYTKVYMASGAEGGSQALSGLMQPGLFYAQADPSGGLCRYFLPDA